MLPQKPNSNDEAPRKSGLVKFTGGEYEVSSPSDLLVESEFLQMYPEFQRIYRAQKHEGFDGKELCRRLEAVHGVTLSKALKNRKEFQWGCPPPNKRPRGGWKKEIALSQKVIEKRQYFEDVARGEEIKRTVGTTSLPAIPTTIPFAFLSSFQQSLTRFVRFFQKRC